MNKLTFRIVQVTVQGIFYTFIAACILLAPALAGLLIDGVLGA